MTAMHRQRFLLTAFCAAGLAAGAARADSAANDRLWKLAERAYQSQHQVENGHIHLRSLIENNPGDVDLAVKCLSRILKEAGRRNARRLRYRRWLKFIENPWSEYAARRLCALERIGAVSANSPAIRDAVEILVEHDLRRGRALDARALVERFAKKQPHDPVWRIARARLERRLGSSRTRALYAGLRAEMDLNHPDAAIRERWVKFFEELKAEKEDEWPKAITPLLTGSPLQQLDPDDPDGEWQLVRGRPTPKVASTIDRLIARALSANRGAVWNDKTGLLDTAQALDLHLLSRPKAELARLRKLQSGRYSAEEITHASDAVALFRRYPWALGAQKALLVQANRMLFAGRAQSALRSFRDVLVHADDAKTRDSAQVGWWAARAQISAPISVTQLLGAVDPDRRFSWLGKPTRARSICERLLAQRSARKTTTAPALRELVLRPVRTPTLSAGISETTSTVDLSVAGDRLIVSGRDLLAVYDARNPRQSLWRQLQRPPVGQPQRAYHSGVIRPEFDGKTLYTRWGFGGLPSGIAAIDLASGRPLWSHQGPDRDSRNRRVFNVPMGDPVLSDGLLYFVEWNSEGSVHQTRGRRLRLTCYDPQRRKRLWTSTLLESKRIMELNTRFDRARPETAIFGNRVTIHHGAAYVNSNCGVIARSDIRDGRTEWIYAYRTNEKPVKGRGLGSAPVIAGNTVVCMPRDSRKLFALDLRTGRPIWENPYVGGLQVVGLVEQLLVVRTTAGLVGLDVRNGRVRWNHPLDGPVLGRAELRSSSVYVATDAMLLRINATTGLTQDTRAWSLSDERPRNFTIHGKQLFVVTDQPESQSRTKPGIALNASMPRQAPPLAGNMRRAWSLPRDNATLALPPAGSPLQGRAFVYSAGMLECLDVTARGRIRWQRFVSAQDPRIRFAGETVVVIGRVNDRIPGVKERIVACDGTTGRVLWKHRSRIPIREVLDCGSRQVLHDGQGKIVALDSHSGRQVWARDLGLGWQLHLSAQHERLSVFFVSRNRTPRHLVLSTNNGLTISNSVIEPPVATDGNNNAKPVADGYYEVRVKPVQARYVRLVALSEVNGAGWASIAELEVIGADGRNLSRKNWKIHKVSSYETKHKTNARPEYVFDGDRSSWWHTPWKPVIVPHPHEIQIDLGSEQTVTGIRYLPAVIINNNGMIRDYELYASKNGNTWGTHIAKGILVQRIHVNRANLASKGLYFETSNRWMKTPRIYRYAMDEKPAMLIRMNARLIFMKNPYMIIATRKGKEDVLVVNRTDDESYQLDLGPTRLFDTGQIEIGDGRLIMTRRNLLIADLVKKKLLVAPGTVKQKYNQNGHVVRAGRNHLLKIVHVRRQSPVVYRFDLRTGEQNEVALADFRQAAATRPPRPQSTIPQFNRVLLLSNSSRVTAWIAAPEG